MQTLTRSIGEKMNGTKGSRYFSALSARLREILQIRASETRTVALLTGLMFSASAGAAVGSPGIEALFYSRFGVQFLPYMYLALGFLTLATSLAITALLGRVDRVRLYIWLPLCLALLLAAARVVVMLDPTWFYPVLWQGMNLLLLLQALVAWGLAGMVCDTRQARRLFPLFGAGGILGLASGGLLTRPLVGWLGTENLLLVWSVALLVASLLAWALVGKEIALKNKRPRRSIRAHKAAQAHRSLLADLQQGYQFVRRSALMRWMSLAAIFFAVLYFALVFPFSQSAAAEFTGEDALTSFLGVFQGLSTAGAFLASLLLANRLYARFGFMLAILVYPLIYLAGFTLLSIQAMFPVLVGLRFMQILWAEGVAEGANQALFNVVPSELREQTRAFVRGVANPLGISLVGVLLIIGQSTLQPQDLYRMGAALAAATLFFVWQARRAYGRAVVENLRLGSPQLFFAEEQPFGGFRQDAAAVAAALSGIVDPDAGVRRVSAEILGQLSLPEAMDTIVNGLDDEDPAVRAALLRSIARARAAPALLEVAALLHDPVSNVRLEAIKALCELTGYSRGISVHLQPLLADSDPAVRSQAAVALLRAGPHPQAEQILTSMASAGEPSARIQGLKALAEWGSQAAYALAARALPDPNPEIRRIAAGILSRIDASQCIFPLVKALGDEDLAVREAVAEALGQTGSQALEPVLSALQNPALENGALLALRRLPARSAAPRLRAYAHDRVRQALDYHGLWQTCTAWQPPGVSQPGWPQPDARLQMLADSLYSQAVGHAYHALRAAGLLGDPETVELAIENLKSRNPAQRANALETLESTGEPAVVRPLLPLWESPGDIPQDISQAAPVRSGAASLEWLHCVLEDPDPWLRACAALASGAGSDEPWILQELERLAGSDPVDWVRESARSALNGGLDVKTLNTLSLMERILFLRRVPLFAGLSPADLKQIAAIAGEHTFVAGEVLAEQDEPGDEMFIIVSGEVRVVAVSDAGLEKEIVRRKSGEYVGEMAIISQEPRMASLIAAQDVRVLSITQAQFEGLLRLRPDTSFAVMRVLCQYIRECQAHKNYDQSVL